MSFLEEFSTVDLILNSQAETRGVDAFALALIKAEKQMRRLVTHLVYQAPAFGPRDINALRQSLERNSGVYFEGLEGGFNALYQSSVDELVGLEYGRLRERLLEATRYRRKIFHGQLTPERLTRSDLRGVVSDIRLWCEKLAQRCCSELSYDGFSNSFRKSTILNLQGKLRVEFRSVEEYQGFIKQHMERKKPVA